MKKISCKVGKVSENVGVVSIIVPVYNAAKFLDMSLQSLQNQTYTYWEALLVNDGSTDDSLQILRRYAANDSRFKVTDKPNGGVASARNVGLEQASGRYIAFLDPDDMLCPQFLDIMLKVMRQNESDMVWCKRKNCAEEDGFEVCETYRDYQVVKAGYALDYFIERRKPGLSISMLSKLYKAEILRNMRFDTSFRVMAEDFEFSLRSFERCGNTACVCRKMVIYRQNSASLTHRRLSYEAVDDHLRLLRFTVWYFKDALPRKARIKLWKRLMPLVFRYVCTIPREECENYADYWQKYSAICRQMTEEGTFFPQHLPPFQHFLCRMFLARNWSRLSFWLRLYDRVKHR